jgi:pSer/pThr/pTyr-binding forkhead associated (FHA) protein
MSEEQTIISPMPDPLAAERTQIAVAPGAEVTQAAVTIQCPVCQTTNPPGDRWCQDCGFLLSSAAPEALELPTVSGPRLALDGREFELRTGPNTLGRVNADVLLPDATVSRHHATLTIQEDGAWIQDEGSTNGTYLNGSPVPPGDRRQLQDGDMLKLGSVTVKLLWPEGAVRRDDESAGVGRAEGLLTEAPAAVAILVAEDGREINLRVGVNTIGRRAENMIVLSGDAFASGRHAEVRCDSPGAAGEVSCVLVDVGSTNGTFWRQGEESEWERLRSHDPQPLSVGDQIRLGQTTYTVRAPVTPAEGLADEGDQATEAVDEPSSPGGAIDTAMGAVDDSMPAPTESTETADEDRL